MEYVCLFEGYFLGKDVLKSFFIFFCLIDNCKISVILVENKRIIG